MNVSGLICERQGPPFGLGRDVGPLEVVDLERAADAVAGEVFEERERHEIVVAGQPTARAA